jgi:hypothetical protein
MTPFRAMIERQRAEMIPAQRLVQAAINTGKPKLVLERGKHRLVFSAGLDDAPYRVTSFDEFGPIGHRDYRADDVHQIAGEVCCALRNGYVVRKP